MNSAKPQRVIVLAFDDVQTLDATGPAEVFALAERLARTRRGHTARGRSHLPPAPGYSVVLASPRGGAVCTTSGLVLATVKLAELSPRASDTVLVAGGEGVRALLTDAALLRWLVRAARVARLGSVCTGAFLLAAAGLLDGERAATHWSACARLRSFRPAVQVDADAIFVRSGRLWTSAGVTTGIDMALAMVEEDAGRALADAVAAELVLYVRRPGFQSQFSAALTAQLDTGDPLAPALRWARAHLRELSVPRLARQAGLSVRTLHRRTHELTGTTPRRLIERLRVEHARTLLCARRPPSLKVLAERAGFESATQMSQAFRRTLGLDPRDVALLFGAR
jgi:transcriptional regulator GlxA family with amidase domain